jgi:hemolysin III
LYGASTLYHSAKKPVLRNKLNIIDHVSIYVLIAGTYTPFTLVTLKGTIGWVIFGISWGLAITGIILKLFFTGKYNLMSTIMYVLMGWVIVFAIKPLINNLPLAGLLWLVAGGISYTIGAILYGIKKSGWFLSEGTIHLSKWHPPVCNIENFYERRMLL